MILCCGEALIDMIPAPLASGAGEGFVPHPGGAIFNTAIALGRLGVQASVLSGVSRDMFGQQLVASLEASQVETHHLVRSDRPTTLAFVQLVDGNARYAFFDESTALRLLAPEDLPTPGAEVTALYCGGISLAVEPVGETLTQFVTEAAPGRLVMLDPNIRPGFIADEARYRARLERLIALADIVKVSDDDLGWLMPGSGDVRAKMDQLLAQGPSLVIVTRGGDGALARRIGDVEVAVPVVRTEVVDTVGAGDTFNAGVLAALQGAGLATPAAIATLSPEAIESALALGAKVAAITVSRAGANPPWREEINAP